MSDVSGVGWTEVLLLKTGDTATDGVPVVVEREDARARCCLDRAIVDDGYEVKMVCYKAAQQQQRSLDPVPENLRVGLNLIY